MTSEELAPLVFIFSPCALGPWPGDAAACHVFLRINASRPSAWLLPLPPVAPLALVRRPLFAVDDLPADNRRGVCDDADSNGSKRFLIQFVFLVSPCSPYSPLRMRFHLQTTSLRLSMSCGLHLFTGCVLAASGHSAVWDVSPASCPGDERKAQWTSDNLK